MAGSCGGIGAVGVDKACGICGGDTPSAKRRAPTPASSSARAPISLTTRPRSTRAPSPCVAL
ncbi:(Na+)-NQR maturation NqrM [Halopseudomonas pachastrellae]|nr:(Na+)-NQR maturation NqrM [Halopseudomonas pachastrellae]